MLSRSCIECGDDAEPGKSRCHDCRLPQSPRPSATQRGYGSRYQRLRAKAIALQPWCECGAVDNLSVDHTPRSWELIEAGHKPTLDWFANGLMTVRCLACNRARGAARGNNVTRHD